MNIYVSDNQNRKLLMITPQNAVVELPVKDIVKVSSMFINQVVENLYWLDGTRRTIEMFSIARNLQYTLFQLGNDHTPLAICMGYTNRSVFVVTGIEGGLNIIRLNISGSSLHLSPLNATFNAATDTVEVRVH